MAQIALRLVMEEVGIGLAVGLVLTGAAVWVLQLFRRHDWLSQEWTRITVIALAFTCFGTAQTLGGSGFIACFAGGMLFGGLLGKQGEEVVGAAETIGDTFALLTWVLFGSAVVAQAVGAFSWPIVLYAVLSLTVVRMLPVFVSLIGLEIDTAGKLFVGWFGPRGLASIVFAVIVLGADAPNIDVISMVVVCTVLLSIIAHGLTANPVSRAFGARAQQKE